MKKTIYTIPIDLTLDVRDDSSESDSTIFDDSIPRMDRIPANNVFVGIEILHKGSFSLCSRRPSSSLTADLVAFLWYTYVISLT